jgi:hypothetical protein
LDSQRDRKGVPAQDALQALRAEHREMLAAASGVEALVRVRTLTEPDRLRLEEQMRTLRFMLPRHLVNEELALYPEVEAADPGAAAEVAAVRAAHLAAEEAFRPLQDLVLALTVAGDVRRSRAATARAAARFREVLEALQAREEGGVLAIAERALAPEARERVAAALRAAALRDEVKRAQGR